MNGKDGFPLHCQLICPPEDQDAPDMTAPDRPAPKKYMILTHGFRSNRYGSVKYLDVYISLGFRCIIYDVRGFGDNAKTTVSLGQFESEDLALLIEDTRRRYGEDIEIGLHGESMGSAISLSVLRRKPKVRVVVADCGFANLYDLLHDGIGPRALRPLYPYMNLIVKLRYGFDMRKTSPVDAVRENDVPICLIHGAEDVYVPPVNSRRVAEAQKGYKELHLVPGAPHAKARETLGVEAYREIVETFLKNIGER